MNAWIIDAVWMRRMRRLFPASVHEVRDGWRVLSRMAFLCLVPCLTGSITPAKAKDFPTLRVDLRCVDILPDRRGIHACMRLTNESPVPVQYLCDTQHDPELYPDGVAEPVLYARLRRHGGELQFLTEPQGFRCTGGVCLRRLPAGASVEFTVPFPADGATAHVNVFCSTYVERDHHRYSIVRSAPFIAALREPG